MGLDIGGTKIAAIAVDDAGQVTSRALLPTGHGAEQVVASAIAAVDELAASEGIATSGFSSIGIGIPGVVDHRTGRVSHAVNLGLRDVDLGSALGLVFGTTVRVENDVNAAALGAFRLLGDPAVHSMAYLNIGTGLAAGLVLHGRLWRGATGAAGELGHILVDPNGPIGSDGQRGGLEAVASGSGIFRQWPTDAASPAKALLAAADAGDSSAQVVCRRFFEGVAGAVRILALTIDVEKIVVGGGMTVLGDRLISEVSAVLASWQEGSPFLASLPLAERIQLAPADTPIAALGAAFLDAG